MGYCVRYDCGERRKKKTVKFSSMAAVFILLAALFLRLMYPQSAQTFREFLIRDQSVAAFVQQFQQSGEAGSVVSVFQEVWPEHIN